MYIRKSKTSSVLVKLPVLLMYLLFLSVQVMFNLDITPRTPVLFQNVSADNTSSPSGGHIWKIKLDKKPGKSGSFLNKRFEPTGMPGFPLFNIHTPIVYAPLIELGTAYPGIYQSACLHKHTLRGPPVEAIG